MNFQPELSSTSATILALTAAFMWGTWFISLKYLGDYPLDGYFITLFTTSFVFVWTTSILIERDALFRNIAETFASDASRVIATVVCGIIYVTGMRFSILVMKTIGLSLAQPIQSAIGTLMSLAITIVVGGVPAGVSIPRLVFATLILIAAVISSMIAGRIRSQAQSQQPNNGQYVPMSALWRSLVLVLVASLLTPAYPFALSYGLKSTTQPNGMAVLPFMTMLVTGAFLGSLFNSGYVLTRHRQWHCVWHAGFTIHRWGIFSGLFHYGGNIIHTYAAAFLSAAIAFPLGITSGLWTQMWGLVYGEFKGSPPRAYVALFGGVLLYIIGGYIIATMSQ